MTWPPRLPEATAAWSDASRAVASAAAEAERVAAELRRLAGRAA